MSEPAAIYTYADFMAAIRGLRPKQRNVLGAVAFGDDSCHHPDTLKALERRELIVGADQTLGGRFPVRIRRYYMPAHVHIRFCEWCSNAVAKSGDIKL